MEMDRERSPRRDYREESYRDERPRDDVNGGSAPSAVRGSNRFGQPAPKESNVLGVFGLSIRTRERDLEDEFYKSGEVKKVVVVYDQRSQRSRGFAFVTMATNEDAGRAIRDLNGFELHGRRIRVDYSLTERPHDPTPGQYMGLTGPGAEGGYGGRGGYDSRGPPPRRYDDDRRGSYRDDRGYDDRRRDDRYDDRRRDDRGYDDRRRGGYDSRRREDSPPRRRRSRSRTPPRKDDRDM